MTCLWNRPTQSQIPNQVTLSVLILQVIKNHSHLTQHWRSLLQIQILNQVTVPVEITQPTHLILHQISLPVDTPQACQQPTHLKLHQRRFYQLHHLNQVDFYIQSYLICHIKILSHFQLLLPVSLPISFPQVF